MPRVSQFAPLISVWTYCRRLHSAVCLLPLLSIELSCLTCRVWPSKVSRKTGSSFVLGVHHWNLASSIFATSWFCKVTHGEASSRQGFFVCLLLCMFASLLIVFALQGHPQRTIHQARFFFVCLLLCMFAFLLIVFAFFVSSTKTSPMTLTYICLLLCMFTLFILHLCLIHLGFSVSINGWLWS